MFKKKLFWIIVILVVLVGAGGGGYYYYRNVYLPKQFMSAMANTATMKTTMVRSGDMTVSFSGIGSVIAAKSYTLAFEIDGTIKDVYVEVGSKVEEGDLLAELVEDTTDETLLSLQAALKTAETNLLSAKMDLQDLKDNAAMAKAEAEQALLTAQADLADLEKTRKNMDYKRCTQNSIDSVYASYLIAQDNYNDALNDYNALGDKVNDEDNLQVANIKAKLSSAKQAYSKAYESWQYCVNTYSEDEKAEVDVEISVAKATVEKAQALVDKLGEDGLDDTEVALYEKKVENAQSDVEEAQYNLDDYDTTDESYYLYAPDNGIITAVNSAAGEVVSAEGAVLTLVNMDEIVLEFYIDEGNLSNATIGMPVYVTFDSDENTVYTGTITKIYPTLSSQGDSDYVQGLLTLDPGSVKDTSQILIGMNAGIEIIKGEVTDTLLVPLEAVRELDTDEYAVFIVENGKAQLVPVTVGLMNDTYAEIKNGLALGDVVSTGITETN